MDSWGEFSEQDTGNLSIQVSKGEGSLEVRDQVIGAGKGVEQLKWRRGIIRCDWRGKRVEERHFVYEKSSRIPSVSVKMLTCYILPFTALPCASKEN